MRHKLPSLQSGGRDSKIPRETSSLFIPSFRPAWWATKLPTKSYEYIRETVFSFQTFYFGDQKHPMPGFHSPFPECRREARHTPVTQGSF